MKNKKGAELSVNVIIVAVIALLVLVVLFAIFTGRMGIFSKGIASTEACEARKGKCMTIVSGSDTCADTETGIPGMCGDPKKLCCVPV